MGWGRRWIELLRRPGLSELHSVAAWRRRLLDLLAVLVVVAMPPALALSTPLLLDRDLEAILVVDALIWLLAIYAVARPTRDERGRGAVIVAITFLLSAQFLLSLGPTHARSGWLVMVGAFAGLFLGSRAALMATVANAVLLISLHTVLGPETPGWALAYEGAETWAMFVVNISAITALTGIPIGLLLEGLEGVLQRQRETRNALEERNRELEESQARLRQEELHRTRLEESLQQARRFEALGRQAGSAVHDLKNALLPIRGYAELAQELADRPEQLNEHLDQIIVATDHANQLAQKALVLRPTAAAPEELVELDRLIRELARSLEPTLPRGIRLDLALGGDGHPIRGEPTALFQVLLNLVTNSISSLADREGTIFLETSAQDDEVLVRVADEGCGMDDETLERAFEPLYSTRSDGSGLGLAISRSIVSSFGGRIELSSTRGEGTTVDIRLPKAQTAA